MRKGLKSKTAVPRLSTTKYILKTYKFSPILIYADLLWGNFCQKFLHFLAKHFQPLNIKMHWRKKIWGRCIWTYFDLFYQRNNITFPSFTKFEKFSYLLNNLVSFTSILGQENINFILFRTWSNYTNCLDHVDRSFRDTINKVNK